MTAVSVPAEHRPLVRARTQPQHPDRFLLYSHDGLGLGHLRRNLSVARALADLVPDGSILLATSAEHAQRFELPANVDILRLPGLRKIDNGRYSARRLNVTWRQVRWLRESLLRAAVEGFKPAVLLVDKHPLGLDGELEPALARLRADGGKAVLGLRDVLDERETVRAELEEPGLFQRIPELYDRVLVYGQQEILDARREYGFPPEVAGITRFCGYVVSSAVRAGANGNGTHPVRNGRPHVLATAGGGEDGAALLSTFVEAAAHGRWHAGVVSGPQCDPRESRRIGELAARAGVVFRRFVPSLASEFRSLDALVCMGGYNTLTEAAASGVSTICVPRVVPRSEQLIRARAFARRGLLTLVDPRDLDPKLLGDKVDSALERDPSSQVPRALDLDGAHRAARHLVELASGA